jgi:hypothetical protein
LRDVSAEFETEAGISGEEIGQNGDFRIGGDRIRRAIRSSALSL